MSTKLSFLIVISLILIVSINAYSVFAVSTECQIVECKADIDMVLDRSGSMSEIVNGYTKLDILKSSSSSFVNKLLDSSNPDLDNLVGLTIFNEQAENKNDLTSNAVAIKNNILPLTASGNTNFYAPITMGVDKLVAQGRNSVPGYIVFFSDGEPTYPRSWLWGSSPEEKAIEAANYAAANNIPILTIGFGKPADLNEDLMMEIADITGGEYYYANSADDIDQVFEYILGEVCTCEYEPYCGDSIINGNEECDDGNDNNLDECRNDCASPYCGDGICDYNENGISCQDDCKKLTPPCDSYGDLNDDGYITDADITAIEQCILDLSCTLEQRLRADVNNDGEVDMADVIQVERYILEIDDTFPICYTPEPPICTSSAWSCNIWKPDICPQSGYRTRTCTLIDTACLNPNNVKPNETQNCTPSEKIEEEKRINTKISSDDLLISSIILDSEHVAPGDELLLYVSIKNEGESRFKNLQITAIVKELGIKAVSSPFTLKERSTVSKTLFFDVPSDTEPGIYYIKIEVASDSDNTARYRIFEVY